ncbi:MAG: tetratricopeptide repeat protein [Desulfuromonadales bacterium]
MDEQNKETAAGDYTFWTPPAGRTVTVGPQQRPVQLPSVPLPLHPAALEDDGPDDNAIGQGVYDYLRQFPDCPHNLPYAELLRDAFPHFLADLGAQVAMLGHKEVDAFYVRRKLTGLKILALLEPNNPGLWQQMGTIGFELALTFTELAGCRQHLLGAMGALQRALKLRPADPTTLNYLAQIDFYLGDYPSAARRWGEIVQTIDQGPARQALAAKLERIEGGKVPDHSLVDDLEAVGFAMAEFARGEFHQALQILEQLEEEGSLPRECPTPEFFYLLGLSRGKTGDSAGAFEAFDKALAIDPEYSPALEGKEIVSEGGEF